MLAVKVGSVRVEIPSSKNQIPSNLQKPNFKIQSAPFVIRAFSLELEIWPLEFIWNWLLEIGVYSHPCAPHSS